MEFIIHSLLNVTHDIQSMKNDIISIISTKTNIIFKFYYKILRKFDISV